MLPDTLAFGVKFNFWTAIPVMHRNVAYDKERFIGINIVSDDTMPRMAIASSGALVTICEYWSVLPE